VSLIGSGNTGSLGNCTKSGAQGGEGVGNLSVFPFAPLSLSIKDCTENGAAMGGDGVRTLYGQLNKNAPIMVL